MQIEAAERFLQDHYMEDVLDADQIRRDVEHWERVAGDAARFPNADLEFIDRFSDAAYSYLGGMSHSFGVETWTPHSDYAGEPMKPGEFRDPPVLEG